MTLDQRREKLRSVAEDWCTWIYSMTPEAAEFLLRILGSLPGSHPIHDWMGEEPPALGWREWELVTDLLSLAEDASDVQFFCERLLQLLNEGMDQP